MKKATLLLALVVALSLGLTSVGFAQQGGGQQTFTADLAPLNGSGASGKATVTMNGNQVTVNIDSQGLAPNMPHAQHFHIGGQNVCPTVAADMDGDGLVNTKEGQPSYGPVKVALTVEGDVSMASGLAVDRFPVADANGNVSYSRTFNLPEGVTPADVANAVVVQHGIDLNGSGAYDGDARSSLDPSLPLEATIPADCGKLVAMGGGAQGGNLPTTGGPSPLALALPGAAALISLGLVGGYLAQRTRRA